MTFVVVSFVSMLVVGHFSHVLVVSFGFWLGFFSSFPVLLFGVLISVDVRFVVGEM